MSEFSHEDAKRLIHKGQMSNAELLALRGHLRTCAACRRHTGLDGLLRQYLVLERASERPSPRFTAVFMESAARRSRRSQIMKPVYAAGGLVALALLMLAGWFIIRSNIQTTGLVKAPELPTISLSGPQSTAPEESVSQPEIDPAAINEQFMVAVAAEDAAEVQRLLAAGANPDFNNKGIVPLPLASGAGELEIVRLLLEAGADVDSMMDGIAPDNDPFTQASALFHASVEGHLDVVELLLANGADPNKPEKAEGDVALHHAAWFNHSEIVQALIDNGAEVDVRRTAPDGGTPLLRAAIAGHLEASEALLLAGADVNLPDLHQGRTPIMYIYRAPADRQVDMINLLLDHGAVPDVQDQYGNTALHIAAADGKVDIVDSLIQRGASIDPQNDLGETALHLAVQANQTPIVEFLIDHGASLNIEDNEGQTALDISTNDQLSEMLREAGATAGSQADTPTFDQQLLAAVLTGDIAKAEQLLDSGANPNFVNNNGSAALPMAALAGHLEIVQLLLEAGADVNSTMDFQVDSGQVLIQAPALTHATDGNYIEIVELLIEYGADLDQTEKGYNETALHAAAWKNYVEIINLLLENGANPDAIGDYPGGETPLHYAVEAGSFETAEALLDGGADVNVQIDQQATPLILITKLSKSDDSTTRMIALLLDRGADPNILDYEGNSALHYAVRESKKEAVDLLIEHGASVDLENNEGQSPLDVATNDEIREILRDAGASE